MAELVLIRHGQSEWNKANVFTGWVDVALSEQGVAEAEAAGAALGGHRFDVCFTSTLQRATETARIVLERLGQSGIETIAAWEVNERYYGRLTGLDKAKTAEQFGAEQVKIWRRSYDVAPPGGESLADTAYRSIPYFNEHILPRVQAGENVLVSAHGNSLRSIVMDVDGLTPDEVVALELATGDPRVYTWDGDRLTRT